MNSIAEQQIKASTLLSLWNDEYSDVDPRSPDCEIWSDYKKPVRERLAKNVDLLIEFGEINRKTSMRVNEISAPQASMDFKIIREVLPNFMQYDLSKKAYIFNGNFWRQI